MRIWDGRDSGLSPPFRLSVSLSLSLSLSLLAHIRGRSETMALTWQYPYKIRVISCPVNSSVRRQRPAEILTRQFVARLLS